LNTEKILESAIEAAKTAGVMLRERQSVGSIRQKSAHHFVTEADLESERIILQIIRERFPEHHIVSEESHAAESVGHPAVWIIDPLDGTNNFSNGLPLYCVSIAFASAGRVEVAAIYDPLRDELFSAVRGQGAQLNSVPISVSSRKQLEHAIVCTGFYYDRGVLMRATLRAIETLFVSGVRGIRRLGSAALDLAWVACGRLDAFFEYQLAPWDYAAGWLLVTEAGGVCSERDGFSMRLDAESIIAGNPDIHACVLQRVPWSKMKLEVGERA
jgi:myo-inositol-1(or 4)-monophosphatase